MQQTKKEKREQKTQKCWTRKKDEKETKTKMVTTRTGHYTQWLVVSPSSSRLQMYVSRMLISRRLLGNDVVDFLERDGKVSHVPDDLALFVHSVNDCDWITRDVKRKMVDQVICPSVHWSQRFHEIVKLLF